MLALSYDFIVVGGGSSGALLARELASKGPTLLIDRGYNHSMFPQSSVPEGAPGRPPPPHGCPLLHLTFSRPLPTSTGRALVLPRRIAASSRTESPVVRPRSPPPPLRRLAADCSDRLGPCACSRLGPLVGRLEALRWWLIHQWWCVVASRGVGL